MEDSNTPPIRYTPQGPFFLWLERQWNDHRTRFIGVQLLALAILFFLVWSISGAQPLSFRYISRLWSQTSQDLFGGQRTLDRAVDLYHEIEIFSRSEEYRFLSIKGVSLYVTATSFRKELQAIIARGGAVRIVVMSPVITKANADSYKRIAESFDQTPLQLFAEASHSLAVLRALRESIPEGDRSRFEVRLFDVECVDMVEATGDRLAMTARSYHLTTRDMLAEPAPTENGSSFDIIVPYKKGVDSPSLPAETFKDCSEDPLVAETRGEFAKFWEASSPFDQIRQTLIGTLKSDVALLLGQ